ncbi:SpoIIIAH-like family protein [Clostridium sp. MSJ-8]|uniref:SpoIIIAH-like family protein n=1 Tax=Clostridium sp. MSJ-8 TaxID=2841510 RepID=UPI001C0F166F|nr:SpoIIIAH-like family protein [Clostridium sp. MSJ-8]MBU5487530.1 SpoIIIAH-like family protein [Clostridium sp. MSJ-8]
MTKKQIGIIFTLLALIVCTALLAGKLNKSGLNADEDLASVLSEQDLQGNKDKEEEKGDTETIAASDFIYEAISERDERIAQTTQEINNQLDNPNIDETSKAAAAAELQKLTLRVDTERTIESALKNKGYEYSICMISQDDKKVDITIKAENIDETESAIIQEIVENSSGIKDVTIQYIK